MLYYSLLNNLENKKYTKAELKTIAKILNVSLTATDLKLTSPKIAKTIIKKSQVSVKTSSNGIKGKRDYMEDNFSVYMFGNTIISGIFDGHGGENCSKYFNTNYVKTLFRKMAEENGDIKKSLVSTIKDLNSNFITSKKSVSGSTVNIFYIDLGEKKVHNINLGDSRSIAGYRTGVKSISRDHKPELKAEQKYIKSKGGKVKNGRVEGILAMSRAVGDKDISEYLNDTPNYFSLDIKKNLVYVLHGSDGLFDELSNNDIHQVVMTGIKAKEKTSEIVKKVISAAYDKGSTDNISANLIIF